MALISGYFPLANDNPLTGGPIAFPVAFDVGVVPEVALWVENTSGDTNKLLINAYVSSAVLTTNTGFHYVLDAAPDSANYRLGYLASYGTTQLTAVSLLGKRITNMPLFTGTPASNDLVPFVSMWPMPQSQALSFGRMQELFPSALAAKPTNPSASGTANQFGVFTDDGKEYFYIRGSDKFYRVGVSGVNWGAADVATKRLSATGALTIAQQVQTFTYASAFTTEPRVTFSIKNTSNAADKLVLHGFQSAGSESGFTVTLNEAPDSENYSITYTAEL